MIWTILSWLLMLFAFGSGASKIAGIEAERKGATKLGINYRYIVAMGILQLVSIPFIFLGYYLGGVVFLGLPYLPIIYFGLKTKDYPLSIFSFVIFCLSVLLWL